MRTLQILLVALGISGPTLANDNPDFRYLQPEGMPLPQGSYGLGVVVEPGVRFAYLTGRTGPNADGTYSADFETQARNALASVETLLTEAGMSWRDVVSITVYLTDRADLPTWGAVRNDVVGSSRPAGTGVFVASLAPEDARVEVTVVAAQRAD